MKAVVCTHDGPLQVLRVKERATPVPLGEGGADPHPDNRCDVVCSRSW
jgi:hypothetical protein